jgi:hypothetical protein
LNQDDKNDNKGDNESISTDQESKISNIGRNEDTDPVRRTVIRSGQVVKPVVRTNSMYLNSPTKKDNHYEYADEEGRIMAQIIDKFNSLNLVCSQQYAMLQAYNLKQRLY